MRRDAQRLRRQFEIPRPGRGWRRAQPDGEDLDLDACVRHAADCAASGQDHERGLYRQLARQERDLAWLTQALNLQFATPIQNDEFEFLRDRVLAIEVRDARVQFRFFEGSCGVPQAKRWM